jgi:hypothetical protein
VAVTLLVAFFVVAVWIIKRRRRTLPEAASS